MRRETRAHELRTLRVSSLGVLLAVCGWMVRPASNVATARTSGFPPEPNETATASQTPMRTTTRLVELSVIVKDKQGNPVTDLTSADFVVRDEKKPQKVRFFRVETSDLPANPPDGLPENVYTNRPKDVGRAAASVTMILFDGLNTQLADQASARVEVVKFLKQIQPKDHVALYALGRDLKVIHDFTANSPRLVETLTKSTAASTGDLDASTPQDVQTGDDTADGLLQAAFQREANFYIQERVHLTVQALTAIAEHVAPLPGRKNLIWVSGSFPFSVGYENVDDILANVNNPTNEQLQFAEDIEKAARALNDANIAVYPVDARGLMGFDLRADKGSAKLPAQASSAPGSSSTTSPSGGLPGTPRRGGGGAGPRSRPPAPSSANTRPSSPFKSPDKTNFQTMDTLAARTGGLAFYNSNDIWGAVRKAVDDSRLTYQIGYYPKDVKWDGSFHNVEVEVKREGVNVRTRKGYFALPDSKFTPRAEQEALRMAATSPVEPAEIAIVVRASAKAVNASAANGPGAGETAGAAPAVALTVRFDAHSISFASKDGKWTAAVKSVIVERDRDGNLLPAGIEDSFNVNCSEEQYQRLLREGIAYAKDIPFHPNAVDVRVILRDNTTGKLGAVTLPLGVSMAPAPKAAN